jgi:hypothetical protein
MEHNIGKQIHKKDIPKDCPKGEFNRKKGSQFHEYK